LYAIQGGHLEILRFFAEVVGVNVNLCLKDPSQAEDEHWLGHSEIDIRQGTTKCFGFLLAIKNQHLNVLKYMLNHLHQLMTVTELQIILMEISKIDHKM
jgi:hypothetical protein